MAEGDTPKPWERFKQPDQPKAQTKPWERFAAPTPNAGAVAAPPAPAAPPSPSAGGGAPQLPPMSIGGPKPPPAYHPTALQSAALGALNIPFADRAASGLRALMGKGTYGENLQNYKAMETAGMREHPYASLAGGLASGLAIPGGAFRLGAGPAAKTAAGALTGMSWGGAQGLSDSPDLRQGKEALGNAMRGAAIGGVAGGVLGRAFAGAGQASDLVPNAASSLRGPPAKSPAFLQRRVSGGIAGNAGEGAAEALAKYGPTKDQGLFTKTRAQFDSLFGMTGGKATRRAETVGREELGLAARSDEVLRTAVEPYAKEVYGLDPVKRADFIHAFETGDKAAMSQFSPKLQQLATIMRGHTAAMATRFQDLPQDMQIGYVENYLAHMWEDPQAVMQTFYGGRIPSSGFTKTRSLPTYRDGIAAGHTPKSDDPLAIFLSSMSNEASWLARKEWIASGLDSGDVMKIPVGGRAPPGMVKLDGFQGSLHDYVAPKGYAEIYNNHYSAGLRSGVGGDAFKAWMDMSNASKAATLGLSGYHVVTVGTEGHFSLLGQGIGEMVRAATGQTGGSRKEVGLHGLGTAARSVYTPFRELFPGGTGSKMIDTYLKKIQPPNARIQEIVDLGTRVNANISPRQYDLRLAPELGGGYGGSLARAFKQGGIRKVTDQLKGNFDIGKLNATAKKAWASPTIGNIVQLGVQGALAPFKGASRTALQAIETLTAPIFETYVPRMKAAVFYDKMYGWALENPTASNADMQQAAMKFWQDVDDRMGLMSRDNLFWRNTINDMLQATMLSPTWNIGTGNVFLGALPELTGKLAGDTKLLESGEIARGLNSKLEYVTGFAVGTMAMGALYEYLSGGSEPIPGTPQNPPQDYPPFKQMHPNTGGVMPGTRWHPPLKEQIIVPGYSKDLLAGRMALRGLAHGDLSGLGQELYGKMNPLAKALYEAATHTDWKGSDTNPDGGLGGYLTQFLKRVTEAYMPIVASNLMKMDPKNPQYNPQTNIGAIQRFIGFREAGKREYDPQGYQAGVDYRRNKAHLEQLQSEKSYLRQHNQPAAMLETTKRINALKQQMNRNKALTGKGSYGPLTPDKGYGGPQ